jgi:lipopolysaccharide export system protein LptA
MKKNLDTIITTVFALCMLSVNAGAQERIHLKIIHADKEEHTKSGHQLTGSVHYFVEERKINIYCDTTDVFEADNLYILRGRVRIVDTEKSVFSDYIRYNVLTEEAHSPGPLLFIESKPQRSLQADRGTYNYKTNVLIAAGNGVYKDSLYTLSADQFSYVRNEKNISAAGNVKGISKTGLYTIYSDQFLYLVNEKNVSASGNVKIFSSKDNAVASGNTLNYQQNKLYGILNGNPRVAVADIASSDSLIISGAKIEYFGNSIYRYVVTDSVTIKKGGVTAFCQKAVYDTTVSKVYLRYSPKIVEETFTVFGKEIDLTIKNRALSEMVVRDSALVLSNADTTGMYDLQNELSGKTINVYFNNGQINIIIASLNAKVTYYGFEKNELQWRQTGTFNQISITLTNGKITNINCGEGNSIITPKNMLQVIKKKGLYE